MLQNVNGLLVLVAPNFRHRQKKCQKKNCKFLWRIFPRLPGRKMAPITKVHRRSPLAPPLIVSFACRRTTNSFLFTLSQLENLIKQFFIRHCWLFTTSYPTWAHGIIVTKYLHILGPVLTRQIFVYFAKKIVIISVIQVRTVIFFPPNFVKHYQTSEAPSFCFGGRQFLLDVITVHILRFWLHDLK